MGDVRINEDKCRGCRLCELGCSFHLHKHYSLEDAALGCWMDDEDGRIEWEWDPNKCDFCVTETLQGPQCIKYCQFDAIVVNPP